MPIPPYVTPMLAGLAGAALVWLAWGVALWHARRQLPPASSSARSWRLRSGLRLFGLLVLPCALVFSVLILFDVGSKDTEPDLWAVMVFLGIAFGGMVLFGATLWRLCIRLDEQGLYGLNGLGLPGHVAWRDIEQVRYRRENGMLELSGNGRSTWAPVHLADFPSFVCALGEHLPADTLQFDTGKTAQELDAPPPNPNAGREMAIASALALAALLVTSHFVTAPTEAIGLASLAGVCLALPNLRYRIPAGWRLRQWLGPEFEWTSLLLGIAIFGAAQGILESHTQLDDGQWLAVITQLIAVAGLAALSILLLARTASAFLQRQAQHGGHDGV